MNWKLAAGQVEFWKNKNVIKIQFPAFWETAVKSKNYFYNVVKNSALDFLDKSKKETMSSCSNEFLQEFWHEHCDFCTEKIRTAEERVVYCTADFCWWMCSDCFEEFKQSLNISIIDN